MSVLSTSTKVKLGAKGVRSVARHPGLLRTGAKGAGKGAALTTRMAAKVAMPIAKRRARRRLMRLGEATREMGQTLVTYGPQAAANLGLIEARKPKRTAPRLAAGAVLGASAVYFLEPEHGKEHREKVLHLVS
jgi:hypothetical protein